MEGPLTGEELRLIDAYWRAANYLSVGQIYLLDNPLLREPLRLEHVKPRLLGHWGTTPGLNFLYAHLNRAIRERDLDAIFVSGPGHGGPGVVANTYLEGTYTEVYPHIGRDEDGPAPALPAVLVPGRHPEPRRARDARLDPRGRRARLRARARVRRGVRQPRPARRAASSATARPRPAPLAASWHSNKFLNPARDGAVLPILHLNGYKIANPTVLARIPRRRSCATLLRGYGYEPHFVEGDEPGGDAPADGRDARHGARRDRRDPARARAASAERPRWPMIVLRTPKGWTGPKEVDGQPAEGTWRSHQVPLAELADHPEHLAAARGVDAELPARGAVRRARRAARPSSPRSRRAGDAAHGREPARERRARCCATSTCPTSATTRSTCRRRARARAEATRVLGTLPPRRDAPQPRRPTSASFGPDETASNRLEAVFEVDRPRVDRRDRCRPTTTSRRTAA